MTGSMASRILLYVTTMGLAATLAGLVAYILNRIGF
jgi:hypothetical protein